MYKVYKVHKVLRIELYNASEMSNIKDKNLSAELGEGSTALKKGYYCPGVGVLSMCL